MKRLFTSIVVILSGYLSQAQAPELDNLDYSKGTIWLTDGQKLTGLMNYDTRNGALHFKSNTESAIYTPRSVRYFSFYDVKQQAVRRYYSLEYEDNEYASKRFFFFEVIEEFSDFAVLSKVDHMEVKSNAYYTTLTSTIGFPTTGFNSIHKPIQYQNQDETLFFMDKDGNIKPYMAVKYIYKNYGRFVRTKVIQKELVTKFFNGFYEQAKAFMEENRILLEERDDFLRFVRFYKSLTK